MISSATCSSPLLMSSTSSRHTSSLLASRTLVSDSVAFIGLPPDAVAGLTIQPTPRLATAEMVPHREFSLFDAGRGQRAAEHAAFRLLSALCLLVDEAELHGVE